MTLEQLRKLRPGPERIRAISEYIALGEEKISDARKLRDEDVRTLIAEHGPAEAARMSGLSLSTVKLIKGRP